MSLTGFSIIILYKQLSEVPREIGTLVVNFTFISYFYVVIYRQGWGFQNVFF